MTSAKGLEAKASAEFKELALLSGIRKVSIERSAYDGVLEVEVEDARGLLTFVSNYVRSEPFRVRFILRLIPVDLVVDTKIEEIQRGIKQLSPQLRESESFRITIEARDSPYSTKQLIDAVAGLIDNKVNLETPDKIVFVQVFGEYSGLSVLEPEEVLSIVKIKRGS